MKTDLVDVLTPRPLEDEPEDRIRQAYSHVSPAAIPATAHRDLDRYYKLLRLELAAVCLTVAEACLICDALNGHFFEVAIRDDLPLTVADAIEYDDLHLKWGVDGKALVAKLRGLTPTQQVAVVDAVERYWKRRNAWESYDEAWRDLGLVR